MFLGFWLQRLELVSRPSNKQDRQKIGVQENGKGTVRSMQLSDESLPPVNKETFFFCPMQLPQASKTSQNLSFTRQKA